MNSVADITWSKPVNAIPYGPSNKNNKAIILIIFTILKVVFMIIVFIKLSEIIESLV